VRALSGAGGRLNRDRGDFRSALLKRFRAMPASERDMRQLGKLIEAGHPCISLNTCEEDYALELVRQVSMGRENCTLLGWSVTRGVHQGLLGESPGRTPEAAHRAADGLRTLRSDESWNLCYLLDLAPHLKDHVTLRAFRDLLERVRERGRALVLIDPGSDLPEVVAAHSTPLELSLPNEVEIEQLIRRTLSRLNRQRKIHVDLNRGQLQTVIKNLRGLSRRQVRQVIADVVAEDRRFTADDINHIVAIKRRALAGDGVLEYVETPVDLGSVGGLEHLKQWLHRRRSAYSEDAAAFGLIPPRGVLMLGVQGAGKSMCAKAIATAWQYPLLRLDPSTLYDRYMGESERRLRDSLRQAESMAPMVLWIDEIEKGFASAASRSNDGGLSQRMFGTLLTWMQEHTAPVFLVATANDIEALPPELLRKGRFDEIFFVDLPIPETRRQILEIHLAKRNRPPADFDLERLVAVSEGYSGAEIEQGIISALHNAFAAKQPLDTAGIEEALRASPPLSVTMSERIDALRRWAAGRCVPAD